MWQRLDKRLNLLLQHPLMGESKEQYRPRLRSVVEGPYIIFYEPHSDGILIYRVLHGARQWEDLLSPDPNSP
jgi:toxin ParE1/3/4